jgi:hypothetical protein
MKKRVRASLLLFVLVLVLGTWAWLRIQPSNTRNWAVGQEHLPHVDFTGHAVTIHNLRDFVYDSAGLTLQRNYRSTTYDLDRIETVWFVLAPFEPDNRGPAHSFLSFGFSDSQFVSISVEARKEKGETYSILKGMLKRYEIMYVVGSETDLIKLRVARGDDVYLYPIKASKEKVRALFVQMLERANALQQKPEFYNTITNNCTTNILKHANSVATRKIPYGREVLLPGYADELARELGLIDTDLPIEEARRRFHINSKARQAWSDARFSLAIRDRVSR